MQLEPEASHAAHHGAPHEGVCISNTFTQKLNQYFQTSLTIRFFQQRSGIRLPGQRFPAVKSRADSMPRARWAAPGSAQLPGF